MKNKDRNRAVFTCGHITEDPHHQIEVKAIAENGKRRADIMQVCQNCLIWYRKNNLIIDTEDQRIRWISIFIES